MNEIVTEPIKDGTYVETSFGREEWHDVEDKAKRKYTDKASAKANNLNPASVRAWAIANNVAVGKRGRFDSHLVRRYIYETQQKNSATAE